MTEITWTVVTRKVTGPFFKGTGFAGTWTEARDEAYRIATADPKTEVAYVETGATSIEITDYRGRKVRTVQVKGA